MAAANREVPDHSPLLGRLTDRFRALRHERSAYRSVEDVVYRIDKVTIDAACHGLRSPSIEVRLTRIEWDVLLQLVQSPGHVLTHEQLIASVWGESYTDQHRLLHDTISRLRRRFHEAGLQTNPIETIHGVGYRLN